MEKLFFFSAENRFCRQRVNNIWSLLFKHCSSPAVEVSSFAMTAKDETCISLECTRTFLIIRCFVGFRVQYRATYILTVWRSNGTKKNSKLYFRWSACHMSRERRGEVLGRCDEERGVNPLNGGAGSRYYPSGVTATPLMRLSLISLPALLIFFIFSFCVNQFLFSLWFFCAVEIIGWWIQIFFGRLTDVTSILRSWFERQHAKGNPTTVAVHHCSRVAGGSCVRMMKSRPSEQ